MHISKPAGPLPASVPFYRQLYFQVVVGILLIASIALSIELGLRALQRRYAGWQ